MSVRKIVDELNLVEGKNPECQYHLSISLRRCHEIQNAHKIIA